MLNEEDQLPESIRAVFAHYKAQIEPLTHRLDIILAAEPPQLAAPGWFTDEVPADISALIFGKTTPEKARMCTVVSLQLQQLIAAARPIVFECGLRVVRTLEAGGAHNVCIDATGKSE